MAQMVYRDETDVPRVWVTINPQMDRSLECLPWIIFRQSRRQNVRA
jgi:hypothetical protein